jgi:hypothetical protein
MHSLGLYKENIDSLKSLKIPLIILVTLTEIQNYIFHHPYFQVYVIEHMQKSRLTDGKLRAFMFVENVHLTILW